MTVHSNLIPRHLHHLTRGLAAVLLIGACAQGTTATTTTTSTTSIPPTTTTTSQGQATTAPRASGCPEDPSFVDRGRVIRLDQPTSDTNRLGLISWQVDWGCERFGLEFETAEGAPATTPPTVVVDFLPSRQILRVWTDVDATVITDQLVETALVNRLYVVRSLEGGMFIDFHLSAPAWARVAITNSPARLGLELHPGDEPLGAPAVVTDQVVVTSPPVGTEIGTDLEVSGYSRVFEANVTIVASAGAETVAETNTTAADWATTWGEFRSALTLPPGQISLFVGQESPIDGEPNGATLDLTVR